MKALILGAGLSGKSANKFLKKLGYTTFLLDDKKKMNNKFLQGRLFCGLSLMVISPGISQDHEIVRKAKELGIEVIGELELGATHLNCPCVAITGTNGKTTTTTLAAQLFSGRVFVGGNIGVPVTSFAGATTSLDYAVLEVSSFQLESIKDFKPHIAVLLNLTVDHLNRHKTLENYFAAKKRIFENQDENDFAVLCADDEYLTRNMPRLKSQVFYFSVKKKVKGCYARQGKAYFFDGKKNTYLFDTSIVPLKGEHNLSNTLAATTCAILAGQPIDEIVKRVHILKGVSHRLEYVADIGGVTFINDSKSTNISSCLVAVRAYQEPINLILGGSDKGFAFDQLFLEMPSNVKNIVVIGETTPKILAAAARCGKSNCLAAKSLKEAVKLCFAMSDEGDVVLLSPACASFDMFQNYEERGKVFSRIVRELVRHENSKISNKKRQKI